MRLQDFPRPANDNGLGIHFGQDLRQVSLDAYVPKMVDMKIKWCLVPHQDELQLQSAARAISAAGILPISRWICKIDQSVLDFARFVNVLKGLDSPPYVQIFNEPGDIREWKNGIPNFDLFVQRWIQHATAVANAGGFPGLQVLDPEELRTVLRALKSAGAAAVLDRMWYCPHPFGANHPPDYPYDARNQQDHPGATVFQDDITVIGFLEFAPVFQQEVGFVPPFIGGEGGWQYLAAEDSRYPEIDDNLHAEYHTALFNSFRTGRLPHGELLPDYLFAFCPWILFGGEKDAWYSWSTGTRLQTVISIQSIPSFTRSFNGEVPSFKPLTHYMLIGHLDRRMRRSMLLGARKYVALFAPAVGFSALDAANAETVTILGDSRAVPASVEQQLRTAGCRVERLAGDQFAVDAALAERVARGAEYG